MKWSATPLDPTPYLNPAPAATDFFGEMTAEERQQKADWARADHEERQGIWKTCLLGLCSLVPAEWAGYVTALDGCDQAACNAARLLYRGDGAVQLLLARALRARYRIPVESDPATWLRLEPVTCGGYRPAPGTNWGDQDFSHGPQRPDYA